MRQDFDLPEDDRDFLNSLCLQWEAVIEGKAQCIIVYGYRIPDGYSHQNVDLRLRIDRTYPDTQIDMVYFNPALSRQDGVGIKAITNEIFDGKSWQRWSRHRTSANPWRIGIDNIETHITLVGEWLLRELKN